MNFNIFNTFQKRELYFIDVYVTLKLRCVTRPLSRISIPTFCIVLSQLAFDLYISGCPKSFYVIQKSSDWPLQIYKYIFILYCCVKMFAEMDLPLHFQLYVLILIKQYNKTVYFSARFRLFARSVKKV